MTLNEAEALISKLEKENTALKDDNVHLKEELEYFKNRKTSGRQPHNKKWTAIYNDVSTYIEDGLSIDEISKKTGISIRSVYRYKAYYDSINK